MTSIIIISICSLLLLSYIFDLTTAKTKIPSVILLLTLGWIARQTTMFFEVKLPDFNSILPVLGTIGLILIVLEGSLELEFNPSKLKMISTSFFNALVPIFIIAFILAWVLSYFGGTSYRDSLTNAIPLCVISSAIAIPSARNLGKFNKEFVVYESSFSDILGVLFFNFIALNRNYDFTSFGRFGVDLLLIAFFSFIAIIGLAYLLSKIDHHIKFFPIILLIFVFYAVSKIYHLPGLIFILLFGLFLGNLDELKLIRWISFFDTTKLEQEVVKFKELTTEAAFLIRSLFFLLFGYLIETSELLNTSTLVWALGITFGIFLIRFIQIKISKLEAFPLLFVAPRGLITILLFLSIDQTQEIPLVNKSLVIQVIILTALVMMVGLMLNKKTEIPVERVTKTKEVPAKDE